MLLYNECVKNMLRRTADLVRLVVLGVAVFALGLAVKSSASSASADSCQSDGLIPVAFAQAACWEQDPAQCGGGNCGSAGCGNPGDGGMGESCL